MNIAATEEALSFLMQYPEFHLPRTARECFSGMTTLDSPATPNLTASIQHMDQILSNIKVGLKETIKNNSPKDSCLLPSELSTEYILDNIHITLITSNDSKKMVPVRNLFKYSITHNDEYSYEVTEILEPNNDNNLLGIYMQKHGSIMLWIDKIIKDNTGKVRYRPELVFQKVLLHEMIHALMDVYPRIYYKYPSDMCSIISVIGQQILNRSTEAENEETLDNVLVLYCYSYCSKEDYNFVWNFIKSQRGDEYNKACDVYMPQSNDWIEEIRKHLTNKVKSNKGIDPVNFYSNFIEAAPDEDDKEDNVKEEEAMHWYEAIKNEISSALPPHKIYKLHQKNAHGQTILLKNAPIGFKTPWIHLALVEVGEKQAVENENEGVENKEYVVKLLIGNIIAYTFNLSNGEGEEKCIDLIKFQYIEKKAEPKVEPLGFILSEKTADCIAEIIRCVNPETAYDWDDFIAKSQESEQ